MRLRVGAGDDRVGDAVGQRRGLARAGAGNDEERPAGARPAMRRGPALFRVERIEPGGGHQGEFASQGMGTQEITIPVLFAITNLGSDL